MKDSTESLQSMKESILLNHGVFWIPLAQGNDWFLCNKEFGWPLSPVLGSSF